MNSRSREATSFASRSGGAGEGGRGPAVLAPKKLMRLIRESAKDLRTAFSHLGAPCRNRHE